jgi:hypothetical protein
VRCSTSLIDLSYPDTACFFGGLISCRSLTDPISFVEASLALTLSLPYHPLSLFHLLSIFSLSSHHLWLSLCSIRTDLCSRDPIPQISLRSELQHLLARPRLRLQPNRLSALSLFIFRHLPLCPDYDPLTYLFRSLSRTGINRQSVFITGSPGPCHLLPSGS